MKRLVAHVSYLFREMGVKAPPPALAPLSLRRKCPSAVRDREDATYSWPPAYRLYYPPYTGQPAPGKRSSYLGQDWSAFLDFPRTFSSPLSCAAGGFESVYLPASSCRGFPLGKSITLSRVPGAPS